MSHRVIVWKTQNLADAGKAADEYLHANEENQDEKYQSVLNWCVAVEDDLENGTLHYDNRMAEFNNLGI